MIFHTLQGFSLSYKGAESVYFGGWGGDMLTSVKELAPYEHLLGASTGSEDALERRWDLRGTRVHPLVYIDLTLSLRRADL